MRHFQFNLLGLLLLIICHPLKSQNPTWFETGASWTYAYSEFVGSDIQQVEFTITEQTIFLDRNCAKLEAVGENSNPFFCSPTPPPYYLYVSNDSVFYTSSSDSEFHLAFDFGAEIGDSWEYEIFVNFIEASYLFGVSVLDQMTTTMAGVPLKQMDLQYTPSSEPIIDFVQSEQTILELIGSLDDFLMPLGTLGNCDGSHNPRLMCFQSGDFEFINPEFGSCTLSSNSHRDSEPFVVFPNPCAEELYFEIDFIPESISVYDINGREILSQTDNSDGFSLNVGHLPTGMYFLKIGGEGTGLSSRFVKQ